VSHPRSGSSQRAVLDSAMDRVPRTAAATCSTFRSGLDGWYDCTFLLRCHLESTRDGKAHLRLPGAAGDPMGEDRASRSYGETGSNERIGPWVTGSAGRSAPGGGSMGQRAGRLGARPSKFAYGQESHFSPDVTWSLWASAPEALYTSACTRIR
jgi:hypothetical protein